MVRVIKKMAPKARVVISKADYYDPATKTVHICPETLCSKDPLAIFRACHEAGHAVQHEMNTWLWRMRIQGLQALTGIWWVCACLVAAFVMVEYQLAVGFAIASILLALFRAMIVVLTEKEASDIAIEWLDFNFGVEDEELKRGREHLDAQRKSYWRVLIGR